MSQFRAKGINPETGRPVNILYGWDSVPMFKAGWFFQVYLLDDDIDAKEDSENCILNLGMLDGITEEELNKQFKLYNVVRKKAINKQFWIGKQ